MNQHTSDELMLMSSDKLLKILSDSKVNLENMSDELAEAICTYKTLERMLAHKLAKIQMIFLDKDCQRNESLDRAKASGDYESELIKIQNAYNVKKTLEIKYEIFSNNIKCLTSLSYLRNTELKNGF